MESLYTVPVFQEEYILYIEDVIRMVTIQTTIQFLYYINSAETAFFTIDFFLLITYVILGVSLYWLVIRKVVQFVPRSSALEQK